MHFFATFFFFFGDSSDVSVTAKIQSMKGVSWKKISNTQEVMHFMFPSAVTTASFRSEERRKTVSQAAKVFVADVF